jgi:hypothetical protein
VKIKYLDVNKLNLDYLCLRKIGSERKYLETEKGKIIGSKEFFDIFPATLLKIL